MGQSRFKCLFLVLGTLLLTFVISAIVAIQNRVKYLDIESVKRFHNASQADSLLAPAGELQQSSALKARGNKQKQSKVSSITSSPDKWSPWCGDREAADCASCQALSGKCNGDCGLHAGKCSIVLNGSCQFMGTKLPCARGQRNHEWLKLQTKLRANSEYSSCQPKFGNFSHGMVFVQHAAAFMKNLEPVFMGEKWPSLKFKRKTLAQHRFLLDLVLKLGGRIEGRLIYIDLGARAFGSSVEPFMKTYPRGKEFIVHAFDLDDRYEHEYSGKAGVQFHMAAVGTYDGEIFFPKADSKRPMMNMNSQAQGGKKVPVINISRWLLENVSLSDFVVVKLDLEGLESDLIPSLLISGALGLVDELMMECHFFRESWHVKKANLVPLCEMEKMQGRFCVSRSECTRYIHALRDGCVFAHEWT